MRERFAVLPGGFIEVAMIRAMPVLQVRDVRASAAFYARLGFENHGFWGEPEALFTIMQRGDVTIALDRGRDGEAAPVNQWWAAYIYVDDLDALVAEFREHGIDSLTTVNRDTGYGCFDFDVIDPDGHRIAFGQALDPNPGPGLGHERGRG